MSGMKELFAEFEKQKGMLVPEIVKNILELMEYTKVTIGKLQETDITEMETSLFSLLGDLGVPESNYEMYLGRFIKNPAKFRFLPGQKATLSDFVGTYCFLQAKFCLKIAIFIS